MALSPRFQKGFSHHTPGAGSGGTLPARRIIFPALFLLLTVFSTAAFLPAEAQTPSQGEWTLVKNTLSRQAWAPAAVVLAGGRAALIVGGYSYATGQCNRMADLFTEQTRLFQPCAGQMNDQRDFAQAVLLPSGQALIAGGFNTHTGSLDTAELYDPATQAFTPIADRMSRGRELFQATALQDGRVLLTGGLDLWLGRTLRSADLFDPKTDQFTPARSPMAQSRFGQAAVCLSHGQVLVVGGVSAVLGKPGAYLASAELFDPKTDRFTLLPSQMHFARNCPTATLLANGDVLIAGGQDAHGTLATAELYHPKTQTFTLLASRLQQSRMSAAAVRLPNGEVLIAGGWSSESKASLASTEIYDPQTETFQPGPPLPDAVLDTALVVFPDGTVLLAGGKTAVGNKASSTDTGAFWSSPLLFKNP